MAFLKCSDPKRSVGEEVVIRSREAMVRLVQSSKPWRRPRVVPPKGAPNILLIMTDDSGYGVPSTFGGVIPGESRMPDSAVTPRRQ